MQQFYLTMTAHSPVWTHKKIKNVGHLDPGKVYSDQWRKASKAGLKKFTNLFYIRNAVDAPSATFCNFSLSLWSYWKIWTPTWILSCRDSSVSWYSLQSASMERKALDHSVCLRNNSSRSSCALFSSSRRWASRSVFSGRLPEISRLFSCSTLQNEQIRRWRCHATNCEQPPKWETSCLSLCWPSF